MIKSICAITLTICFLTGCGTPRAYREVYEPDLLTQPKSLRAVRTKTIVIDAGHGGKLPGAVGPTGLKEKDVVLDITKRLKKLLEGKREYKVLLTRSGDYDVSLLQRRELAKRNGADLFISIHCDGNRNKRWNGTAVYVVSDKGANITKERALTRGDFLIDQKNMMTDQTYRKNKTLVDLLQTGTRQESHVFARTAVNSLTRELHTKNLGVKAANFAVLKILEVPSVLVEVAFITNWWEEKLLRKSSTRQRVAKALYGAIEEYFRGINE